MLLRALHKKRIVGNDAQRAHPQGHAVAHAEHVFKQARAGHHARGAVNREKHQDHQRSGNAQDVAAVFKAVGEVVGQGQGVANTLGIQAQARGDKALVEIRARRQADGNPRLRQAQKVHQDGYEGEGV